MQVLRGPAKGTVLSAGDEPWPRQGPEASRSPDPRRGRIAAPVPGSQPAARYRRKGPAMVKRRHRGLSWADVEKSVKLLLRISSEVVRLIIELHGGR